MKIKAAATAARKALEITTVNLDGRHTDEFTRSGAEPEGLFAAMLSHAGIRNVVVYS